MKKNKLFKFLKVALVAILIIPCCFSLSACGKLSAYELAVENGFVGTEQEWLNSLKGKSAYELAVENGFVGTEQEWLDSLKGDSGKDAESLDTYDLYLQAVEHENYSGTYLDFIKENLTVSSDTTSLVASKSIASVVTVSAYSSQNASPINGSGIIYDLDENGNAIIVTNYHVTYSSSSENKAHKFYDLFLYGQDYTKVINATFVGGSADYDISVLKVTASDVLKNSNAQKVSIDTNTPKLGTTCLAVGNPNGDGIAISRGVVSVDSEPVKMTIAGVTKSRRLLRHDCYITGGSSGGGLFDMNGNLIGITNGGEKNDVLINYAIPSNIVYNVVENILNNCLNKNNTSAKTFILGLTTISIGTQSTYNKQTGFIDVVDTVKISSITEDGAIAQNGILKTDDILKSATLNINTANQQTLKIERYWQLKEFLLLAKINDTITLEVSRTENNETSTIYATITLDESLISVVS